MTRTPIVVAFIVAVVVSARAQQNGTLEQSTLRYALSLAPGEAITPIPADPQAPTQHALVFDWFRVAQLASQTAKLKGTPLDPDHLPPDLERPHLIVVGLPVQCGNHAFSPERIELLSADGSAIDVVGSMVRGGDVRAQVPHASVPEAASAMVYARPTLRAGDIVRVTYPAAACGDHIVTSPPATVRPILLNTSSTPALQNTPPPAAPFRFTALVDQQGQLQLPTIINDDPAWTSRLMTALQRWRFDPMLANGVPVPTIYNGVMNIGNVAPPSGANANAPQVSVQNTAPRPDLAKVTTNLETLAIEMASKGGPPAISLDADGSKRHGILLDRFRLGVIAARAQIAAGQTPTPTGRAMGGLFSGEMAVVAFPLTCDGKTIVPQKVSFVGPPSPATGRVLGEFRSADLHSKLAGVSVPDGSLLVTFSNQILSGATVTITYDAAACPGPANEAVLHLAGQPMSRLVNRVSTVKLPPDSTLDSPTTVHVSFMPDFDGHARFVSALDGPPELKALAEDAGSRWQYAPADPSSTATPTTVIVPIAFTADGNPPPPTVPAGFPGRSTGAGARDGSSPAPLAATSRGGINGGDATHDTTSGDIAGLTIATSKCAVADDDAYGFTMDHAIKSGGDMFTGPSREVKYLNALRGPTGQGIHFRRLGSTIGPDKTILDLYEITYAGLDKPLRVYVDAYHFDELKAPKGLLCGSAIGLTAK